MRKYFCCALVFGALFVLFAGSGARAAELVMFERAGCEWCAAFDREIEPIYGNTQEGKRAPLRRVDATQGRPADLAYVAAERLTPLFVLVDRGREIGRIRGYPGNESFWMRLAVLIDKLDAATTEEHSRASAKISLVKD